jgi:hypothetical protein
VETEVPHTWGRGEPEVVVDHDEVLVIVDLGSPETVGETADQAVVEYAAEPCDPRPRALAEIAAWRESTRDARMALAASAERQFGRKVSWGARSGEVVATFTAVSVPVMTRLRLSERQVLDTLIDAGIARSRSEALAWCVRLVGDNEGAWVAELRDAFAHVEAVRDLGPRSRRDSPDA